MSVFRSFSVLAAALSIAGAAHAQTQAPPNSSASAAPRESGTTRMAAATAISSGMEVKTPSGDSLGTVASIVPSTSSGARYVVIAGTTGSATAVPYAMAAAMVRNDALVMDKSRLLNAPKVQQDQMEDGPSAIWQKKADSYWSKYQINTGAETTRPEEDGGPPR